MKVTTCYLATALCLLGIGLVGCRSLQRSVDPSLPEDTSASAGIREPAYTLSLRRPQLPESASPGSGILLAEPLLAAAEAGLVTRMAPSLYRDPPEKAPGSPPSDLPRLPSSPEARMIDRPSADSDTTGEPSPVEPASAVPEQRGSAAAARPAVPPARTVQYSEKLGPAAVKPDTGSEKAIAAAVKRAEAPPGPPAAAKRAEAPPSQPAAAKRAEAPPDQPAAAKAAPTPPGPAKATEPAANLPAKPSALPVEQSHRQLLARNGDEIVVDLQGSGWIYLGARPETNAQGRPAAVSGLAFLSQKQTAGKSSFAFRADEIGRYELVFQHQDNTRAVLRNEIVHLQVLPEEEFLHRLSSQAAIPLPEPAAAHSLDKAEKLFAMGEHELALIEFLKAYREGDAYLNDRLAACYAAGGEHLAAIKYYRQNLGAPGEYGDRAVLGMVRSSLSLSDSELLMEVLPSLFTLQSQSIEGDLLEVARFQSRGQRYPAAIRALEEYLDRYPGGARLDEVYYRLAQIHETDSPNRDLRKARDYYRLLYQQFPESRFVDIAGQRIRYLDRHFFLVQ